jgi:hypothetical protein
MSFAPRVVFLDAEFYKHWAAYEMILWHKSPIAAIG